MITLRRTPNRLDAFRLVAELGGVVAVRRSHGHDRAMGQLVYRRRASDDATTNKPLESLSQGVSRAVGELHRAGILRLSRAGRPHGRSVVKSMLSTADGRRWAAGPVAKTHRGTSNGNSRGGSVQRARRRQYLVNAYGDGTTVKCALQLAGCTDVLTVETVTVDRIVPGCQGGTYRRDNIQPACAGCNSRHGSTTRRSKEN